MRRRHHERGELFLVSLHRLLGRFGSRSIVPAGLGLVIVLGQLQPVMAAPLPGPAGTVDPPTAIQDPCAQPAACTAVPASLQPPTVSLPAGAQGCPASGPAAACRLADTPAGAAVGQPSLPSGATGCPVTPGKTMPPSFATCSGTLLDAGSADASASVDSLPSPAAGAIAIVGSKHAYGLSLTAGSATVPTGVNVLLTATATNSVTGTDLAIEIFDETAGTLVAACGELTQCAVDYAAKAGAHTFAAFLTTPTTELPAARDAIMSNPVTVGWLDAGITAGDLVAAPGERVTVNATSSLDVQASGRWLEIYDVTTHTRLTYCTRGSECTTSIVAAPGSVHELVAHVTGSPESVSSAVKITWLTVTLSATTLTQSTTGTVYLQAAVNADLTNTPWMLGIYDDHGHLVGQVCKAGWSCSATATIPRTGSAPYTAQVSAVPADVPVPVGRAQDRSGTASIPTGVVARSAPVKPGRLLWGVDSCKALIGDPSGVNLYPQVASALGAPDFWGRYLTDTVCPGISQTEVAVAAENHMGILPIYNAYDCSAVAYYQTGAGYAASAVAAANSLGIPLGRGLAIDIEPPGPACPGAAGVDSGFILGWYDGVRAGGYVPIYYGNGTAGSEFGSAWCTAVASSPGIAANSYLWSFEPDLQGGYTKANAPAFSPYNPGCPATSAAWQYEINLGATPEVDHDLALSTLPLWFPGS